MNSNPNFPQESQPPAPEAAPARCVANALRRLSRRVTQIYDHRLAAYGLTGAQFGLLRRLAATPGVGSGALAARLVMDATTLSRNLAVLERRGLVRLEADGEDRRGRRVRLTPAGERTLEGAVAGWRAAQAEVAAALGAEPTARLLDTLDSALDALRAAETAPVPGAR